MDDEGRDRPAAFASVKLSDYQRFGATIGEGGLRGCMGVTKVQKMDILVSRSPLPRYQSHHLPYAGFSA